MNTIYLKQPDGSIAYDDSGSGPLVICIPSMGDLRGEYRYLAPQLVAAGYRVITMDVRGHGETSTGWADYSVGAIGSDILALIRSLDAGPATIIGTSMAAGAAVWAAAEAPSLVADLVLVGPFVRGEGTWRSRLLYSALFARPWGPSLWLRYYSTLYPTQKPADFALYCRKLQDNLAEPGRIEALRRMILASKAASEERLPRVTAPVLVIMGSKDPDFKGEIFKDPESEAHWVANRLRGIVQMIKDAGHYPHTEMPEITGSIITHFLQTVKDQEAISHVA
jgi:pimeloyl-ACP methyl ester carboxylesterase